MRTSVLQRVVDVHADERRSLWLSFFAFFCILCAYYVLKPLRDQMGVAGGVRNLPWLFWGTFGAMLVASPMFAALVTWMHRRTFIMATFRFFMVNLLLFFIALKALPDHTVIIGRVFFIWVSVFNLFVVSVFWSLMVDAFRLEQSKRIFGFIAAGGTLGAVAGSLLAANLTALIGGAGLIAGSLVLLELALRLMGRVQQESPEAQTERRERGSSFRGVVGHQAGSLIAGLTLTVRSPYMLGICLYLFLYTLTSTFLYFAQASIVDDAIQDPEGQVVLFARMYFWTNVLTLLTQLVITARVIRVLGVGLTLTLVPFMTAIGCAILGSTPELGVLVVIQVLRSAGNFALAKPARETLFTVVPMETKYKAKNFIDTVVYRGGDAVSGSLFDAIGGALATKLFLTVPVALVWMVVGLLLGRCQGRAARRQGSQLHIGSVRGSE